MDDPMPITPAKMDTGDKGVDDKGKAGKERNNRNDDLDLDDGENTDLFSFSHIVLEVSCDGQVDDDVDPKSEADADEDIKATLSSPPTSPTHETEETTDEEESALARVLDRSNHCYVNVAAGADSDRDPLEHAAAAAPQPGSSRPTNKQKKMMNRLYDSSPERDPGMAEFRRRIEHRLRTKYPNVWETLDRNR